MAQGLFGGATSYEEQSLPDILSDITSWINYTLEIKDFFGIHKKSLHENKFWEKISYDFQSTIVSSFTYFDTILYDFNLIKQAIDNQLITEKETQLLRNIGSKAIEYNIRYGKTYNGSDSNWHEYGSPKFRIVEKMYCEGRDYFVSIQDAGNAAARLENYMEKGQVTNNTLNINGKVSDTQIQQGTINSTQNMTITNDFDYNKVLETLEEIRSLFEIKKFQEDFGVLSDEIKKVVTETIDMVQKKESPSKIKQTLNVITDISLRVSSSVIASGIIQLINQLPIF